MDKQVNKFLLFCFSLLPGAGYMYLGLTQKGFEAMVLFFSIMAVSNWIGLEDLLIPMFGIPLYFYFFFDTFAVARKFQAGEDLPDRGMLDFFSQLGESRFTVVGIAMMVIGVFALGNNLIDALDPWQQVGHYVRQFGPPALLIGAGAFLYLRGRDQSNDQEAS